MNKLNAFVGGRNVIQAAALLALFGTFAALLAGCSRPEEAASPSPTATAAGSAVSTSSTQPMPGGAQGDAAYYSKTYGAGAGGNRPR